MTGSPRLPGIPLHLTVSILKNIRNLSPLAIDLIDALLKGEDIPDLQKYTLAELTNEPDREGSFMTYFLPVVQVNADDVYDLMVFSGFHAYDDVYRDLPEDERPPMPTEATPEPAS